MQSNDIIMVNVTGTNGTTRNQRTISRSFDGTGKRLNEAGQQDTNSAEILRNLPSGAVAEPPAFPAEAHAAALGKMASSNAATKAAGVEEAKQIQLAYAEQINAWEKLQGGGNEKLQIAKAVLEFTKEFHEFREDDGNHFVMKLENLDVTTTALADGRTMYQVTGTAIFG